VAKKNARAKVGRAQSGRRFVRNPTDRQPARKVRTKMRAKNLNLKIQITEFPRSKAQKLAQFAGNAVFGRKSTPCPK